MTPVLHLHGTTRAGAEWVRDQVGPAEVPSTLRIALIGPTAAHVRSLMIEGDGGLLEVCPLSNRPRYGPARRRLTWPNGAIATCYSADKPDQLRGPQHHIAWADELASWRFVDAWDQLQFGLRLGDDPRCLVTREPAATRCDFCGKTKREVRGLVAAGDSPTICDECVGLAVGILTKAGAYP